MKVKMKEKVIYTIKTHQQKRRIILRSSMAFLALSLIILMNWIGLSAVGQTVAYYYDNEISTNNMLCAGPLDFMVRSESQEQPCEKWTTYTQGGWGAKAHGNNPGSYRDAHFDLAFPQGVMVGDEAGFTAKFTTSSAIEDFLPAEGTPGSFAQDYLDPTSTAAGVLAGQTLALTLSIKFDSYDPDFSESNLPLSGWVILNGPQHCNGKTVQEVLDESHSILAGLPSVFSASQANECAAYVNEKFNGGNFSCEQGPINTINWGATNALNAVVLEEFSGINWHYRVRTEKTGGLDDFCNILDMEAFLNDSLVYNGDLMSFISPIQVFTPSDDTWRFVVTIPPGAPFVPEGEFCEYDLVFEGWQNEFPDFPGGFHDIEKISNKVTAGQYIEYSPIVINEFLPNPIGDDDATMPDGEWVELYNNSSSPIDLTGWHLYDSSDSHPVEIKLSNSDNNGNLADGGEIIIPGNGYFVVYLNQVYSPGWLNNTGGDSLRLYNGTVVGGILVDSYAYTGAAPENKSYARIPDGTGDFVDPIPTPLKPNVLEAPIILTEDPVILVLDEASSVAVEETNHEVAQESSSESLLDLILEESSELIEGSLYEVVADSTNNEAMQETLVEPVNDNQITEVPEFIEVGAITETPEIVTAPELVEVTHVIEDEVQATEIVSSLEEVSENDLNIQPKELGEIQSEPINQLLEEEEVNKGPEEAPDEEMQSITEIDISIPEEIIVEEITLPNEPKPEPEPEIQPEPELAE